MSWTTCRTAIACKRTCATQQFSQERNFPAQRKGSVGGFLRWKSTDIRCAAGDNVATTDSAVRYSESLRSIPGFKDQIRDVKGALDGGLSNVGGFYEISGWVRTIRSQKSFSFVEISDGSTLSTMQAVLDKETDGYSLIEDGKIHTGSAIILRGQLVASPGGKQKVELKAEWLDLVGGADPVEFPLQKKRHTLEFLRSIAHLRGRTNTIGAIMRVRSALCSATHDFFCSNGFYYLQTPIISGSDCEGAGEMFQVTAIQNKTLPASSDSTNGNSNAEDDSDYSRDFFGRPTYLTVSGQLNAEAYACALGRVYTFGPTFRAENSNTSRHLAEFWMLEPEMAFCDLAQNISCAEAYLRYCVSRILEDCPEEIELFDRFYQKGLTDRLQSLSKSEFERVTYTDAVRLLQESRTKFEFKVEWGRDLQSEHERYLTEEIFGGMPVAVTDYPKDIKSFYMKLNDDGKTVAAVDVLVPGVGELIGGSQREDDYEKLKARIIECGLSVEDYWWYLDLRKFGSVPHSGFGVGFERFVQFVTGMENIRDVIPFPRYPGHCSF